MEHAKLWIFTFKFLFLMEWITASLERFDYVGTWRYDFVFAFKLSTQVTTAASSSTNLKCKQYEPN
jgi:hypothetical protein